MECDETGVKTVLISLGLDEVFLKAHFALKFYNFQSKRVGFLLPFRLLCQLALVLKCFV